MNDGMVLLVTQIVIILVLFVIVIFMLRQNLSIRKERRISSYSIEPLDDDELSLMDKIKDYYMRLVRSVRKYLKKSGLLMKMARRYEKYVVYGEEEEAIDFIFYKITVGLIFVVVTVFSLVLQLMVPNLFELLVDFLVGYYLFDLYLIYNNKKRVKLIKNEMLRAIIIMNNAFKSGKSTMQAVYIAANELPEPISSEFKKIYRDMKYGLEVGTVFERFAKRIDIEEARYLSASLVTLNRTGGNIIKVFSSIERTLFDKKKLEEELKNLTMSSNLIVKVLLFVPALFVLIIYFLDPTYFNPLFESMLGYMILVMMGLMFICYIFVLRRVMKVEI